MVVCYCVLRSFACRIVLFDVLRHLQHSSHVVLCSFHAVPLRCLSVPGQKVPARRELHRALGKDVAAAGGRQNRVVSGDGGGGEGGGGIGKCGGHRRLAARNLMYTCDNNKLIIAYCKSLSQSLPPGVANMHACMHTCISKWSSIIIIT